MTPESHRHDVEDHGGDMPVCVGQWCCGCAEHPVAKPWGWNWRAWDEHYREAHAGVRLGRTT